MRISITLNLSHFLCKFRFRQLKEEEAKKKAARQRAAEEASKAAAAKAAEERDQMLRAQQTQKAQQSSASSTQTNVEGEQSDEEVEGLDSAESKVCDKICT